MNGTLVVHGDGQQSRDYVYLDDVVRGMAAAATAPTANGKIINIGSGKETTVRELMKLAVLVTGGKPEVVYNPRTERGPDRMCADLSLAQQVLNYQPQVSLLDGLRLTLEKDPRLTS